MNTKVIERFVKKMNLDTVVAISTNDKARLKSMLEEDGHKVEANFIENMSYPEFETYVNDLDPLNF